MRRKRKWSTWGTEWVDWPFFSSKEELDFVLLLVQHAVAIVRIREISRGVEAREKIVERALACLDSESEKLRQTEDILRRQHQKTKADIGRLVEILKKRGVNALSSIETELSQLETEERGLKKQLLELEKDKSHWSESAMTPRRSSAIGEMWASFWMPQPTRKKRSSFAITSKS